MTTQSAVLPDRPEVLPRTDFRSLATETVSRRAAFVVQPRHGRPASAFVDVLLAHGLDSAVVAAHDESLPDPGSSPLAILVGADSLSQARADGRLDIELDWIRRADQTGTTVLGVGHGARVLALAFGGAVTPAEHPLRGWAMVDTNVPHIIPTGPWLAWQHDVITLPAGARLLAHNRLGPQAFRVGRHLGVQFHPEATPEAVAEWAGADDAPDVRSLLSATTRDEAAAANSTWRLLSSFIGNV
jgi:GMP synthase-like glutamine amidotransferase